MLRRFMWNGKEIEYNIYRKNVKNINIRVRDGMIKVSANTKIPILYIEKILRDNMDNISSKLEKGQNRFLQYKNDEYNQGDKILYLGKYYEIKLTKSEDNYIKLDEKVIIFSGDINNKLNVKKIIDIWLKEKMEYIFNDSLNRNFVLVKDMTDVTPKLKYRKMIASWGNCRMPSGVITLNKNLIKAPIECIDYVVIHELVHLVYQDHGKEFYSLLNSIMPDWKIRKKELED